MKYIMGNWKMNMLPDETLKYIEKLDEELKILEKEEKDKELDNIDISLFVPFINIFYAHLMSQETRILIGAQNMHYEEKGAFTGEVSAEMLKSVLVDNVLIGHSERRHVFGESDIDINKKLIKSQEKDLRAIFCIGETLEENETGKTEEVIKRQILEGLKNVDIKNIIIAYEPVWAIGTGKVCDSDIANNIVKITKEIVKENFGLDLPVLYGGSVDSNNAKEILNKEYLDGVLVGGASLTVDKFLPIIKSAMSGE